MLTTLSLFDVTKSVIAAGVSVGQLITGYSVGPTSATDANSAQGVYIQADATSSLPLSLLESQAGFTSSNTSISPPSTVTPVYGSGSYENSALAACSVPVGSAVSTPDGHYAYTSTPGTNTMPSLWSDKDLAFVWQNSGTSCTETGNRLWIMTSPCKVGYTWNSTSPTCRLTSASTVNRPFDGVCKTIRTNNTYATAVKDPDCTDPNKAPIFTNSNGTLSIVDSSNSRNYVQSVTDSAGRVTITEQKANTDDTNIKTVITTEPSTQNGVTGLRITGVTTSTTTGSAGVGGQTVTPTSGGSGSTTVNVPSNLAKTEDIDELIDAVKGNDISQVPLESVDSSSYDSLFTNIRNLTSNIPRMFDFSLPALNGSCQPYTGFSILGRSIIVDYCDWINLCRDYLSIFLFIFTPFSLFNILVRGSVSPESSEDTKGS